LWRRFLTCFAVCFATLPPAVAASCRHHRVRPRTPPCRVRSRFCPCAVIL
jgi:hypothetical protein